MPAVPLNAVSSYTGVEAAKLDDDAGTPSEWIRLATVEVRDKAYEAELQKRKDVLTRTQDQVRALQSLNDEVLTQVRALQSLNDEVLTQRDSARANHQMLAGLLEATQARLERQERLNDTLAHALTLALTTHATAHKALT